MNGKVYLISSGDEEKHFKIGYTGRTLEKRLKELKIGNSRDFEIVAFFESKWAKKIEHLLHKIYVTKKISGEWYVLNKKEVSDFIIECDRYHRTFEYINKNTTYKK